MMRGTRSVLILVADRQWRETCADWLARDFHVRTAADTVEARSKLNRAVDVVVATEQLLRADDLSVEAMRTQTGACHVVCLADSTTATPTCDESIRGAATQEGLQSTVGQHLAQTAYDRTLSSFYALVSTKAELEAELDAEELAVSTAYANLSERVETLRADLVDRTEAFESDWGRMFELCQTGSQVDTDTAV